MKPIISPVKRELIEKELTPQTFVRKTNNGNNEIYIVTYQNSPNILREIGRLREISFRDAGGGTGDEIDLDEFDYGDHDVFDQLFVWNPRDKEIVGGYRYLHCRNLKREADGLVHTPTAHLFEYSDKFISDYLPITVELGRSFVQPKYQPANNLRKGMYSLDNLWDGLGAIIVDNPEVRYFFGKFTMYPQFNRIARDLIHYFLDIYFGDKEKLVWPIKELELQIETPLNVLKPILNGGSFEADYKILIQKIRSFGENIPPLVNAYMSLSSTMKSFGTAMNYPFGNVEETGIIITIGDIYDQKIDRHVTTYFRDKE
ncbi:MAG: GNAT family N-acetyltransferase [Bacteroidota bacterium]|nr:GNAT family N-acetyltransferase [Bacteroidota bacterium]